MAGEQGDKFGAWLTVTLTGTTISAATDLGSPFVKLLVLIPTVTSGSTYVHVSNAIDGSWFPLHVLKANNSGDFGSFTSGETATKAVVFDIGGAQFVKMYINTSQTVTYLIRGFNP